jgi:hypothetical protein
LFEYLIISFVFEAMSQKCEICFLQLLLAERTLFLLSIVKVSNSKQHKLYRQLFAIECPPAMPRRSEIQTPAISCLPRGALLKHGENLGKVL